MGGPILDSEKMLIYVSASICKLDLALAVDLTQRPCIVSRVCRTISGSSPRAGRAVRRAGGGGVGAADVGWRPAIATGFPWRTQGRLGCASGVVGTWPSHVLGVFLGAR